jgi:hypothetical protein
MAALDTIDPSNAAKMRRPTAILVSCVVASATLSCNSSTGPDEDDDRPRFEFSDFRLLPAEACGTTRVQAWVGYDLNPVRDIFFDLQIEGESFRKGLVKATAFGGADVMLVTMEARRIEEAAGLGSHTVTVVFEEPTGSPPRNAGPFTTRYTAKDCS